MGIHVTLERSNRIQYGFNGRWDWDDLEAAAERATQLAAEVDSNLEVIFDLSSCGLLAGDAIFHPGLNGDCLPRGCDVLIIVGATALARSITNILCRAYPQIADHYHSAHNLKEAHALLNGRGKRQTRQLARV